MNVLIITDRDSFEFESIVYLLSNSWSEARRQAKELFLSEVETEKQEKSSLDEDLTFWDDDADYGMITWASGFTTKYVLALVNNLPFPKEKFAGEERREENA